MYKIQVVKGKKQWFWRIVARNGKTLAHSETYSSKGKAVQTAKRFSLNTKIELA